MTVQPITLRLPENLFLRFQQAARDPALVG
jgi:hypothetical protein